MYRRFCPPAIFVMVSLVDSERQERALTLSEGRRLAYDEAMWQAPSLTLLVQAFLLGVLTDGRVGWVVAISVAAAGVAACLTAGRALAVLHAGLPLTE